METIKANIHKQLQKHRVVIEDYYAVAEKKRHGDTTVYFYHDLVVIFTISFPTSHWPNFGVSKWLKEYLPKWNEAVGASTSSVSS